MYYVLDLDTVPGCVVIATADLQTAIDVKARYETETGHRLVLCLDADAD